MPRNQNDQGEDFQENPRRRTKAAPARPSTRQYYGDEQPDLPKVRRASLRVDPATISGSTSAKLTRIEKDLYRHSAKTRTLSETSTRIPSVAKDTGKTTIQLPDEEEPVVERKPSPQTNKSKIMVAQRRRPTVYEPPASALKRSRSRPVRRRTLLAKAQNIARQRPILVGGVLILICLLLLPAIMGTLSRSQPQGQDSVTVNGDTQIGSAPASPPPVPRSSDPRQLVIIPPKTDHPAPPVNAVAAFLLDADTNTILYAHNPFMHLPILSTTKLMTATLAVEQGDLNKKITISDAVDRDLQQLSADSSVMGIKKGETYTLRELLYGLMLVSGNDAAIAIADGVAGNVQTFVARMNTRAQQLGLHDTHYMNPHGLLMENHYSSAYDLAQLGKHSMSLPVLKQISATRRFEIPKTNEHPAFSLTNGNQFLWWYPGVDGGKPGFDGVSNFVQVISCTRNNHHLIGVTIHTTDWWTDMRNLMNWGFNTFTWVSPHDADLQSPIPYDADWNYFTRDKRENSVSISSSSRYYIYTGYTVSAPLLSHFDKNGGLKKFGFPTGPAKATDLTSITQQFEHGSIQCDLLSKTCS